VVTPIEEALVVGGESFSPRGRAEVERAARVAGELSGLTFSTYVGVADGDARRFAEALHAELSDPTRSVLVFVDPANRYLEIVTGREARRVLPDADCRLVVLGMQSSFVDGDLVGGLTTALQQLGEHARRPRTVHADEP
jgi:Domain of unknown function (DUF5130)